MASIDLQYWKGHHVLALRGDSYYPAVIYEADNASSRVFVEIKNGGGLLSVYYDVFNVNVASPGIISDIIPPYVDILNNMKVAVRVSSYGTHPFDLFAPGFVCDIVPESGRFLVRTYSGQESIVGPEDIRLLIYPWSQYSMYYLQCNISYNKSDANSFQPQFPTLQSQYCQQEAFHPTQEVPPSCCLPTYSEAPKQFSQLSANNFSGCQIVEKENMKTELSDYYNVCRSGIDSPYPSITDSERINQWNAMSALFEKKSSYPDVIYEETKKNMVAAQQTPCGPECKDQNCVNAMPKPVTSVTASKNDTDNSVPRVKRKYTKRKNVQPILPKNSSFVPLEQQNLIKTRKPNAFFIFCKEYRNSVTASSYNQTSRHISQKLAEIWRLLPPEEKKKYQDKAKWLEKEELIKTEWSKLNSISKNYNGKQLFTINTDCMPGPNTQGNMIKTEAPNSYSDDEPRLVIDESRFDEDSEDNASPLFVPKYAPYSKESPNEFPGQPNTSLQEEDIKIVAEIKSTLRAECDTTSNFENEKYLRDTKPKTLVGGTFFPPDFSAEKAQNEVDNDITILTDRITKELFDDGAKRHTAHIEKKYNLIIQLFKDHGYYPTDYFIDEFFRKYPDIFVDKKILKDNIIEVRERVSCQKDCCVSFLPLSPQLREILSSVMNNGSPLTIPGYD